MIYATSDLHGYPLERFQALLKKAGFGDDDFLFVLGDVIDRYGDGGVAMLRWMMAQPNVELLLGNHEGMLLGSAFLFEEITDESLERLNATGMEILARWMRNGADVTIEHLRALRQEDPEALADLLGYIREAPLYETVGLDSGDFLLVHGGLGGFRPDRPLRDYAADELLWERPGLETRYFSDAITVLGHTPTRFLTEDGAHMLRTETWIDIDTSAPDAPRPMLLRLDDLKAFYPD